VSENKMVRKINGPERERERERERKGKNDKMINK
jgi:hypothetical protein